MPLAAARNTKRKDGKLVAVPVAAGAKIFKGGLVILDGGYAKAGAQLPGVIFVGVAYETVDNTGGAAGAVNVRIETDGTHEFKGDGVAADLGKVVYLSDDETVKKAAGAAIGDDNIKVGIIVAVPAAGINRILIDNNVGSVAVTI
jgi:hypothetical protein